LEQAGFIVGQNVAIEYRYAEGRLDRLPSLAAELIALPAALLVATGSNAAVAAKQATATIPIVFGVGPDPVQLGLVESFSRPGGNATGVHFFGYEVIPKRLELLREVLPQLGLIAIVIDPQTTSAPEQLRQFEAAAQTVGQPILVLHVRNDDEIDKPFAAMAEREVQGLLYGTSGFFQVNADKLIALAARYRIPASYEWREFCRRRRLDELQREPPRSHGARRRLRRTHPEGGRPSRFAGHPINTLRAGHQSRDRQSARPDDSAYGAAACRRGHRMKRREVMLIFGVAAVGSPLIAGAQQKPMPVIGYLGSASAEAFAPLVAAFREGLKEAGYVEGRNVAIEFAWAAGQYDKLPALAEDFVRPQVAVIVASGGAVAGLAAKAATSTVPIVLTIGDDPVKYGLVLSFSHPGGNITGITLFIDTLTPKRLEILTEMAPVAPLASVINSRNPNAESEAKNAQAAAQQLKRDLIVLKASNESEIDAAFASIAQQPGSAVMIATDPCFFARREQLAALAARYGLPAVYFHRGFAVSGGLISYGATITEENRIAGQYTGRILAGEKPGDLPILQPAKIELVVNLKTAAALGVTVPPHLLVRDDEVIE
jgi:putative ABC transport system substrate-binding protein